MLQISQYDFETRLAVVERCGANLRPQQISLILAEIAQEKQLRQQTLEYDIQHPDTAPSDYHLPLDREPILDQKHQALLKERCMDLNNILKAVAQNCSETLLTRPTQMKELIELGDLAVKVALITSCGQTAH